MATPERFAEGRSNFRAISNPKKATASVKARLSKSLFSVCETMTDFPTPGFPRYHRMLLVSPKAHSMYSGLSKIGIGGDRSVVYWSKSDFALRSSTRLLLTSAIDIAEEGTVDHEVRFWHRCHRHEAQRILWRSTVLVYIR